ncbi:MAG: ABC transporter ATP-binding protein, partial [Vicinamibacteria bacterium]
MEQAVLVLEEVHKSFGDLAVLRGVSLEIRRGETMTILGGSGSGKSVILKNVIGLEKPDSGRILFDGVDLVPLTEVELAPFRRRMGFLFQGAALFDSLTVADNIAYPLVEEGRLGENEILERVREALQRVGLDDTLSKMPADLSGGMRKRVGLARAIVNNPEVIFYDEPTTGL